MTAFSALDLLPSLQASLAEQGLVTLTEIQARALPALLAGRSIVGVAETGGGKTLAYALPILHALKTLENDGAPVKAPGQPRAVIMVPTRELGEQVSKVLKPFTHTTRLRVRTVLGGTALDVAKKNISGPFEVLVATPGRLIKLLDRKLVQLSDVRILVFDEADQMLDEGFLPDATQIAAACPDDRQLALFSATVSRPVQTLMERLFQGAEVIRSSGSHQLVATLTTYNRTVVDGERQPLLEQALRDKVKGGTLLFANTREQVDALAAAIHALGRDCVVYRGEMDKVERRNNLKAFRDGKVDLLVSTDLASRGLDVAHVGRVINVHLPHTVENYLHRVGRTARAGRPGVVINFVTPRDRPLLEQVEALEQNAGKAGGPKPLPASPRNDRAPKPRTPPPTSRASSRAGSLRDAAPAERARKPAAPKRPRA